MKKFFKLSQHGTNISTEIIAGITTFFTMAYIIFANPDILAAAGMDKTGVMVATIIAAVVGTLIMGLVANVPYASAPGMGLNAFFAYVVCGALGFKWQEALVMVFICGIINIIITVTKIRKSIIKSIPSSLQNAIGGGIGLFIAYIGIKNAGFLTYTASVPTDAVAQGVVKAVDGGSPVVTFLHGGSGIVPALANFNSWGAILSLIGLVLIVVLMAYKVKGAMLIGIVSCTALAVIATIMNPPAAGAPLPAGMVYLPEAGKMFDISAVGAVQNVAFKLFGSPGFASLFADSTKILTVLVTVFAFSLSDTFDTIGTFIGTGRKSGIFDQDDEAALENGKGFKSKMDKALFADSIATSVGAIAGTSNTTTYIESAAGIQVGGRTGLTSVVTAVMFMLCLPFVSLFGIVPAVATAPVLIVVGILMSEAFGNIKWHDLEESIPAFLTILITAFAYNISYGIAAGFIFYCLIKILKGKIKEVHPILLVATILFIANFVISAMKF